MVFLVMFVLSFRAQDRIGAFAVTLQAGTVLLISPEVLRPLRHLRYFNRPLTEIRAKRRRLILWGVVAFCLAVAFSVLRGWGVDGSDSNDTLTGALDLLGILVFFTGACLLATRLMIDSIFEGAAESWLQTAVGQFDSARTSEVRLLFAGAMFLIGTLLLFWAALS